METFTSGENVTLICRCCLCVEPSLFSTNLNNENGYEYFYQLLSETFNIQFSDNISTNRIRYICGECQVKISNASEFKKSVIGNEGHFLKLAEKMCQVDCDTGNQNAVIDSVNLDIKHEAECFGSDYEAMESEDDVYLSKLQIDIVKTEEMNEDKITNQNKKVKKKKKIDLNVEVLDSNTDQKNTKKDWNKLAERRGNGPILRDNSLKLIENSNICVFQWNKSRYCCFCCKQPFLEITELKQHTKNNHTLKEIEKKIILQQNRLVKVEITSLSCKLCEKGIENVAILKKHLREDHRLEFGLSNEDLLVPFKLSSEELQCQLCDEKHASFRHLNIHMNKHFQKEVCHVCGAGFSNLVFLNMHRIRYHRPLRCKLCRLEFKTKLEKRDHDVAVHNLKIERKMRFPCPVCGERFFQENFRVLHLVEKHAMPKPDHRCLVCQKSFVTRSLRNNHVKNVHKKEKNRQCDICQMRFYTKTAVSRHRVTHTGEKNFSCNLCNNLFATKDSLRRHLKRTHVRLN